MKEKYGLPWNAVFEMCRMGIKDINQIDENRIKIIESKLKGTDKVNFRRIMPKILKEKIKETCTLYPLPFNLDKIIVFDTEYVAMPSNVSPVLVGFWDSGNVKQFWFYEKGKLLEFFKDKKDYKLVHYRGVDKKVPENLLEKDFDFEIIDILNYIQTSLVAQVEDISIFDALVGHKSDE